MARSRTSNHSPHPRTDLRHVSSNEIEMALERATLKPGSKKLGQHLLGHFELAGACGRAADLAQSTSRLGLLDAWTAIRAEMGALGA